VNRFWLSDVGFWTRKPPRLPIQNRPESAENRPRRRSTASSRPSRGFTLIETALATIIIGVGVLALVAAQQGFHQQNNWSTHASIALNLGNEIREMTLNLPQRDPVTGTLNWGPDAGETFLGDYDDLDDFDGDGNGIRFSAADGNGPVNARREIISHMDGWSQTVRVFNVNPLNITEEVADGSTNLMVVEVRVDFQGLGDDVPHEVTTVSWLAPK
jgi:type II secretory pathway pseudopilin PulG